MRSEQINELVKAIAAANAEMEPPSKNKAGKVSGTTKDGKPYQYEYHYADLAAIRESYREPYSKHGLTVTHSMAQADGHLVITTTLMHESGQWCDSAYPVAAYAKPQEQGSAITYAKRYNVCMLADIVADDDDDGAAAQQAEPQRKPPKPVEPKNDEPTLTPDELEQVFGVAKRAGITSTGKLAPVLERVVGVSSAKAVPRSRLEDVLRALANEAQPTAPACDHAGALRRSKEKPLIEITCACGVALRGGAVAEPPAA